jgi:hypothetical protein
MSGLGKCSVAGCNKKANIEWPLCGSIRLCNKHYNNPPEKYKDLVNASKEPPDDFDYPDYD